MTTIDDDTTKPPDAMPRRGFFVIVTMVDDE